MKIEKAKHLTAKKFKRMTGVSRQTLASDRLIILNQKAWYVNDIFTTSNRGKSNPQLYHKIFMQEFSYNAETLHVKSL
ncbi:MAG: hypothetical protein KME54_11030 [Tolypothrix brevis GSE-NOS-MK-07-07A]|nr:hypothetical protein [Tolypothrix brevis GSE-NOS-MK-07-07A]